MEISLEQFEKALKDIRKNNSLYVKILRIGLTFIDTGISYNGLKSLLEREGYDFNNNCIELAVKQWFYDSFHHKGKDGKLVSLEDLDNHLDCGFILKGDSGLLLADHDASKMNLAVARKAMIISIIALMASILIPINDKLFSDKGETNIKPANTIIVRDTVYMEVQSIPKASDTLPKQFKPPIRINNVK